MITELRTEHLLRDEGRPFVLRDGDSAEVHVRGRGRVGIDGPARLHLSGHELVIVDTRGTSSYRLSDVRFASVRTIDPVRTAGLIGLIVAGAAATVALFVWAASVAPDFGDIRVTATDCGSWCT